MHGIALFSMKLTLLQKMLFVIVKVMCIQGTMYADKGACVEIGKSHYVVLYVLPGHVYADKGACVAQCGPGREVINGFVRPVKARAAKYQVRFFVQ